MSTSLPDKYRATNIDDIVEIRPNVDEGSSYPYESVSQIFRDVSKERGDRIALVSCRGIKYTWMQYYENSHRFARALISIGLKPFDTVSVIGFNAPEYMFAVHGCIEAGGVATGIYATNGPDACFYVMNHCNSAVVVVDGQNQLKKMLEIRARLPNLRMIVVYNADDSVQLPQDEEGVAKVRNWVDFLEMGSEEADKEIDRRVANQKPGQCVSLIYTSGTTGNPKAVMISDDNIVFVIRVIQKDFNIGMQDRLVSFLPLSHIAAQMIDIFAGMVLGFTLYFARPDALKGSLVNTLREVQPTIFVSVPRVFEKMVEAITAKLAEASCITRMLSNFARKRGTRYCNNLQVGTKKQRITFFNLAKKILTKVQTSLGLSEARLMFSAAAPIDLSTVQFLASFGLPLFEIFGMSESSGPTTFHTLGQWKMATAGKAMRGSIVKTVPGSNEIIVSGRHVFMGYLKMPEETLRVIDDDGFLHSGDCGSVDADGFWKVTGRIKELIVTAGGENIPPILIESELKRLAPALSNVVLIGDKRKYLTVLLTLNCRVNGDTEGAEGELLGEAANLMKTLGSNARTAQEASEDQLVQKYFYDVIQQYNMSAFSNAQK